MPRVVAERSAEFLFPDSRGRQKARSEYQPDDDFNITGCDDGDDGDADSQHHILDIDRNWNADDKATTRHSADGSKLAVGGGSDGVTGQRNSPLPSIYGTAYVDVSPPNARTSNRRKRQQTSGEGGKGKMANDIGGGLPRIKKTNGDKVKGSQQQQHHHRRQSKDEHHVVNMSSCLPALRRTLTTRRIKETIQVKNNMPRSMTHL